MHETWRRWAVVLIGLSAAVAAGGAGRAPSPVRTEFVRVQGTELLGPDGTPLRLKGIGLGNWLLPEGYMFGFKKGAQSPRQIHELVSELVGPDEARAFWTAFRDVWGISSTVQSPSSRSPAVVDVAAGLAAREALAGLVENSRFARVRVNPGYVRALGLEP